MKKFGLSEYVFGVAVSVVLFSFLVFYLVDLRNIFGWRDVMFTADWRPFYFNYTPFFFNHWGRNGGIAEILQFLLLGGAALLSAFCAGALWGKNKLAGFWGIMSAAFVLMLLEDAGNIRHLVMSYVQAGFGEPDQGVAGTITEFLYFSALAALPLYALIKYWEEVKQHTKTKIYLLVGFASYALAASLSFVGTAFDYLLDKNLYTLAGEKFYELALRLGDAGLAAQWQAWEVSSRSFPIGFSLMDSLVEEGIELLGAGAFLAAVISYLIAHSLLKKNNPSRDISK